MACAPDVTDFAEETLLSLGYSVVRNRPYAGGFITQRYGVPARGLHAIQIEINRGLYMNERTLARKSAFTVVQEDMKRFASRLMDFAGAVLVPPRQAAE